MRIGNLAVAVGLVVAGAATGVAYAATSGGTTVHACTNSKGTLRLIGAHGHCPKHFKKVSINQRGQTGARGPKGNTGNTGPAGPGAVGLSVTSTSGLVTKESAPIAGSELTVEVLCDPADDAQVYLNLNAAGTPFTFEGTAAADLVGSFLHESPGGSVASAALGSTAKIVNGTEPGDAHSVEFTASSGTVTANILVAQGSKMFNLQLGAFESGTSCWSHAMVTPVA
jgi:hypothetical protein